MTLVATLTASAERDVLGAVPCQLLIGGWTDSSDGGTFAVQDPATEEDISSVADATPADASSALAAASSAQAAWSETSPRERAELLRRAFEAIHERLEEFALLITLEMGKPLAEARSEVIYGAEFLRWFSEEAVRLDGRYSESPDGSGRILVMNRPVGPTLLITPWNFPLAMVTRKVAPALAAGCTCVLKPARQAPLTSLLLGDLFLQCGLPEGALNIVTTSSSAKVFAPLIDDPRARKLSFTGSTEVGQVLTRQASNQLLRVSMELGGNAPFLVFDDADLDQAVAGAVLAKTRNQGESCVAANRFLVHEKIAEEFIERFVGQLSELKVGRGTDEDVNIGPLIDQGALKSTKTLVRQMVDDGADLVLGGQAVEGPGWFFPPTVLTKVPTDSDTMDQELFSPVAPISTFTEEGEAIQRANDTDYGLVAYVFTRDLPRSLRVCEQLEVGMVGLNRGIVSNAAAPFGGIKRSGQGREGGHEGILEYTEVKYVAVDL